MRSSVKPLSFATLAVICTLGDGLPLTSVRFSLVNTAQYRPLIGHGICLVFSDDAWIDPRKDPPCNDNYPRVSRDTRGPGQAQTVNCYRIVYT